MHQEAAVNEIIDTQPLNLKTYFLTIDTPPTPPTRRIYVRLFDGHRLPLKRGSLAPTLAPKSNR
jgi:hypothetical protein